MRVLICALAILLVLLSSVAFAGTLADTAGVIRVFGDASSWMSCCFVVGDGSWVLTTSNAITEKAGPDSDRTVRYPVFISAYTGQAYQCEFKAQDKDLGVALLKLPVSGLPSAPLGQMIDFSKAASGTMGQIMSGEPVGNSWATEVYGVSREKTGETYKLAVSEWTAAKAFVCDIDKYKWLFVADVGPERSIPDGAMIARGSTVIGMYLSKLVFTGLKNSPSYGRCAMSTEMARFLGEHGVDTATLYTPPKATIERTPDADKAFQLQARVYSQLGSGQVGAALESASALAKLWPADAQAQMMWGLALTANGKFDEAIKAYDEAAKLDPKLPTLRASRALALFGLKKTSEAESELLKAIDGAPTDVRPTIAITDFYLGDEKTYPKALDYAKRAISMSPDSPAVYLLLARAEKRNKDYKAATEAIAQALKMAPDWGEAYYALGATCEEGGDKDSAEKAYRKLAEKQPKNPDSLMTLASFLADQGKKDEALQFTGKIRELKPPQAVLDAVKALEDKINGVKPTDTKATEAKPAGKS